MLIVRDNFNSTGGEKIYNFTRNKKTEADYQTVF